MATKIDTIEGIGPTYAGKLNDAGIGTVEALLDKGATRGGRGEIAEATGLSEKQVLKWVNMADLMRIKGVGEEYSELLEAAGVDTVAELKMRNAENLTAKMEEVNAQKKLVRSVPSLKSVQDWVEQAKSLPKVVTY
jgi:predicted flap endonuclease-1-like 5' DNA nuclease